MDKDNNLQIVDELKSIFENVNGWLKFAEAKNGALVAINGVFIFKCTDFLINLRDGKIFGNKIFLIAIMTFFLIALLFVFVSFLPDVSKKSDEEENEEDKCVKCKDRKCENILMFYGDIAKYTDPKLYLNDLYMYYYDSSKEEFNKKELDYAKEIIINSQITLRKFKIFKYSIRMDIIGLLMLLTFWIFNCLQN